MRVICTAGHVDHGKSALVEALSGIHPDRLIEEQKRAMTIDLGFAWIELDGEIIGIVDVPGHQDFIENMLAGVSNLDAFLLVVDVNEGIMPQTREHLVILQLMGMQRGVVALTKIDTIQNADDIELATLLIQEELVTCGFADVPIVPVSAHQRMGLNTLLDALRDVLANCPLRTTLDSPILPIDRVFTMQGFGTVVTGTLSGGTLAVGDEVEIQPNGLKARIRGLQSHNLAMETVEPGRRVAVNLAKIAKQDIRRGNVLSLPGVVASTSRADVVVRCLPQMTRPLRHNETVKVFIGPGSSLARVRLLDSDELAPGHEGFAQLEFQDPLPLRDGDRFVMRIPSPAETIGGGRVLSALSSQRWKRNRASVIERFQVRSTGTPLEQLVFACYEKNALIAIRDIKNPALLDQAVAQENLIVIEDHVIHPAVLQGFADDAQTILTEFHRTHPLKRGMSPEQLLDHLGINLENGLILRALIGRGYFGEEKGMIHLPNHRLAITKAQQKNIAHLIALFEDQPYNPPSHKEALHHVDESVLRMLIEDCELVFLKPDVLLLRQTYREMLCYVRHQLEAHDVVNLGELRDAFSTSRRIAMPFLDYLEAQGATRRTADGHILKSPDWAALESPC
ncbi:MAG: selenocysteine-specific translation elongation factor [Chloroflexi bacterium]|nr:selenocysteine-specific translation elongation factor [Chloroflexota bacterium]